jgi:hypothetical protein
MPRHIQGKSNTKRRVMALICGMRKLEFQAILATS